MIQFILSPDPGTIIDGSIPRNLVFFKDVGHFKCRLGMIF